MIKVTIGRRAIKLPFWLEVFGVTPRRFEQLVDGGIKAELLDEVMMAYCPYPIREKRVADFLRSLMGSYAAERSSGRVLAADCWVHLSNQRRVIPDAAFVQQPQRRQGIAPRSFRGIPELVIEIVSPLKAMRFLHNKSLAYMSARVREIWAVNLTEKYVIIERLRKTRYTSSCVHQGRASSTVVPGFWVDVAWLWEDELPEPRACLRAILG